MTKFTIPTTFMGTDTKEAYDRVINAKSPEPVSTPTTNAGKIDGFIYVPTANLHFSRERTHLNVNWNDTHGLLATKNLRMPTIEEFRITLKYCKESSDRELKELYDEITQVRDPWRAEHLDAYFEKRKDGLYILTENKTKPEKLESCLMKDKTPGVSLDEWISGSKITNQGLPNSKIAKGELYYWSPRDKFVARFYAYSDWADLYCNRDPSDALPELGVYAVTQGV